LHSILRASSAGVHKKKKKRGRSSKTKLEGLAVHETMSESSENGNKSFDSKMPLKLPQIALMGGMTVKQILDPSPKSRESVGVTALS
jgi:hypothetical protein